MNINIYKQSFSKKIFFVIAVLLCFLIILLLITKSLFAQNQVKKISNQNKPLIFTIKNGYSIDKISQDLYSAGLLNDILYFKIIMKIFYQDNAMAGSYFFDKQESIISLTNRISNGKFNVERVKVTIPEGSDAEEVAWIIMRKIPSFDAPRFLQVAKKNEGYLFPETYFFNITVTPQETYKTLRNEFDNKINSLKDKLNSSQREKLEKNLHQVIVMASLIEEEAKDSESRRIISGIFWKRLRNDWPLQVDASLVYVTGRASLELTKDDLILKSPFNTYINKGLPPQPISNPGLDSIIATLEPIETDFWYYLSDKDEKMHYARNLDEHKINRQKYLDK